MPEKLEELAEKVWTLVLESIKRVLEECDLHGIAEIIYVKDPSVEERLKTLEGLETIFGFIEDSAKDPSVKQKMANSKVSINMLKVLLAAVRNHDQNSFDFAKNFLERDVSGVSRE